MGPSGTSTDRMRSVQYVLRRDLVAATLLAANLGVWAAYAQAPAAKLDRVIGEVTAIDAGAKRISLKSDAGAAMAAIGLRGVASSVSVLAAVADAGGRHLVALQRHLRQDTFRSADGFSAEPLP